MKSKWAGLKYALHVDMRELPFVNFFENSINRRLFINCKGLDKRSVYR